VCSSDLPGCLEGQTRLPNTAGTGKSQEARGRQPVPDVGQLAFSADEAGQEGGEVVAWRLRHALARHLRLRGPSGKRIAAGEAQKGDSVLRRDLEDVGDEFGHLFGGPSLFRFEFANRNRRAADLVSKLLASQIQRLAAVAKPIPEGVIV